MLGIVRVTVELCVRSFPDTEEREHTSEVHAHTSEAHAHTHLKHAHTHTSEAHTHTSEARAHRQPHQLCMNTELSSTWMNKYRQNYIKMHALAKILVNIRLRKACLNVKSVERKGMSVY